MYIVSCINFLIIMKIFRTLIFGFSEPNLMLFKLFGYCHCYMPRSITVCFTITDFEIYTLLCSGLNIVAAMEKRSPN